MCGIYVCVHKTINTRTDTDPVQQPNEYLVSLLLLSVQTPLVYEGSPPTFDAIAQGRMEREREGKDGLTFCISSSNRLHQHF